MCRKYIHYKTQTWLFNMAVRRRQKISHEKRQLLVRAFDDPEQDYLTVADT